MEPNKINLRDRENENGSCHDQSEISSSTPKNAQVDASRSK